MLLITLTNVAHRFAGRPLLFEGLNAELRAGELIALTGPSGSGKSTLLSILAGWVRPAMGEVLLDGVHRTSWVFQNPHGVAGRSALDHVSLPIIATGKSRGVADLRALEVMEMFRIDHLADQPFKALSGGEAQRLMLARAIAGEPDLLLVDEPTAQLDLGSAATVNEVLGLLAAEQTIVVVATHDQNTREACHRKIDLTAYLPASNEVPGFAVEGL